MKIKLKKFKYIFKFNVNLLKMYQTKIIHQNSFMNLFQKQTFSQQFLINKLDILTFFQPIFTVIEAITPQ